MHRGGAAARQAGAGNRRRRWRPFSAARLALAEAHRSSNKLMLGNIGSGTHRRTASGVHRCGRGN
eukprot:13256406-Alexandrium_andersonii.AAC.1